MVLCLQSKHANTGWDTADGDDIDNLSASMEAEIKEIAVNESNTPNAASERHSSGLAGTIPGTGIEMGDQGQLEYEPDSKPSKKVEDPDKWYFEAYLYPAAIITFVGTIGIAVGVMVGLGIGPFASSGGSDVGGAAPVSAPFVPTPAPTVPLPTPPPTPPPPAPVSAKMIIAQSYASVGEEGRPIMD